MAGMGTYVVSDIHGCYSQLQQALELAGFCDTDQLYVLGDIIDRGPQIGECIEWLVRARANDKDSNVRFLMGNHEEMATWAFCGRWSRFDFDDINLAPWEINGGTKTIEQMRALDPTTVDAFQRIVERAPHAVTAAAGSASQAATPAAGENGERVLLCHAGIRPAEPEAEEGEWLIQSDEDLLWIGNEWYCAEEQPPFHVVSGHTPTFALASKRALPGCTDQAYTNGLEWRMMHWGRKHDIDCGCVYGGNLGLLRLDDWQEFYVPAEQTIGPDDDRLR